MWSLSELTQAIVIVAHVHALSVFLAGCKLYSADAVLALIESTSCSESPAAKTSLHNCTLSHLSHSMSLSSMSKVAFIHSKKKHSESGIFVDCVNEFVRSDAMTLCQMKSAVHGSTTVQSPEEDSAFDDYVFSWPEHRCLLFNHLYPDIGSLLEDEFQSVLSLSSGAEVSAELGADPQLHCVAIADYSKDWLAVDRDDQMESAWLFVQYLFGIHRDDCDYSKVLLQLSDKLKAYIKLLVCFPNRIYEKEFEHITKAVSASDLVGLNLLVTEARLEAELIFGLYAINRNMNKTF